MPRQSGLADCSEADADLAYKLVVVELGEEHHKVMWDGVGGRILTQNASLLLGKFYDHVGAEGVPVQQRLPSIMRLPSARDSLSLRCR